LVTGQNVTVTVKKEIDEPSQHGQK